MRKYVNLIRIGIAIVAYLVVLLFGVYLPGMAIRAWMAATRATMTDRRRWNASYIARSGAMLKGISRLIMGMDIHVHFPNDARESLGDIPFVYVSNHRSVIDGVFLPVATVRAGHANIRWVVKQGVRKIPLIAGLMEGCGYAIVIRRKDMEKLSDETRRRFNRLAMRKFFRLARDEAACVGLFPEGERFVGAKDGAKRRFVGDPTPGKASFREMCAELPCHGVAVVTVLWPTPPGGKTVFDAADLCDRVVDITVQFHPHVGPEVADRFLEDAYDRMDGDLERRLTRSPRYG